MVPIDLNDKVFKLIENSAHGAVSDSTTFHYTQQNGIVTARYKGGGVLGGQILAKWKSPNQLEMRYHCIMDDQSLKAGKAIAEVTNNNDGLLELHLDWQWLGDLSAKGQSIYIEVVQS